MAGYWRGIGVFRGPLRVVLGSYRQRLYLAFAALAAVAILLAGLGWHVLQEAEQRVLRGRIASDIFSALYGFTVDKAALRNWSYRRILDQAADAEERLALIESLNRRLATFEALNVRARQLDQGRNTPLAEFAAREHTVLLLSAAVGKLDDETSALLPGPPSRDVSALAKLDLEFDRVEVTDVPALLAASLAAEQQALEEQRRRADAGLRNANRLFIGVAGSGLTLSVLLAIWLALRLREPLRRLDKGLEAYAVGDFGHRFTGFRDREFIALGDQLNAMAAEVTQSRQREARFRTDLEDAVRRRTVDLTQALDELAASEEARQQFLIDVGHELRTPVTVIRGEAQVALRSGELTPEYYHTVLGRIIEVTRQMGRLIEDLLVFVRDPQGKLPLQLRDTTLDTALRPALELTKRLAESRGISVTLEAWNEPLHVRADPERLAQVISCLLDNAVRYSYPSGQVRVWSARRSGAVLLCIADQGIGIAEADLPHVFTRGWRSSRARDHRAGGLGLGLAIAEQLVRMQGGQLTLACGDGGGIVATLRLPAAERPAAETKEMHSWTSC